MFPGLQSSRRILPPGTPHRPLRSDQISHIHVILSHRRPGNTAQTAQIRSNITQMCHMIVLDIRFKYQVKWRSVHVPAMEKCTCYRVWLGPICSASICNTQTCGILTTVGCGDSDHVPEELAGRVVRGALVFASAPPADTGLQVHREVLPSLQRGRQTD